MRRQYLHLCAYPCDVCAGPVIAGSLAVRENEISKESDIRLIGSICLSCSHRQSRPTELETTRHFPPVQWETMNGADVTNITSAYAEALARAGLYKQPV